MCRMRPTWPGSQPGLGPALQKFQFGAAVASFLFLFRFRMVWQARDCMSTTATNSPPRVNHVFIDYENVHALDLDIIGNKAVNFTLLLGAKQKKLEVPIVEKLLAHAASVHMVRLGSSGKNALDFALAYYLGRATLADPNGAFHIVSKDKGYDPLIEHLQSKNFQIHRHSDFNTLNFTGSTKGSAKNPPPVAAKQVPSLKLETQLPLLEDRESQVLEHLRRISHACPRTSKTLQRLIVARFKFTEQDAGKIVENLEQAGHITLTERGVITYRLGQDSD